MSERNNLEERKKVLEKLILKEEDILEKLDKLSNLAIKILKIEESNANIQISNDYEFSYKEKIKILAIGKYFAKQYGIIKSYNLCMQDMLKELGDVKRTTLSGPLGELVKEKTLIKPEKDLYFINQFKIEEILLEILSKYNISEM